MYVSFGQEFHSYTSLAANVTLALKFVGLQSLWAPYLREVLSSLKGVDKTQKQY